MDDAADYIRRAHRIKQQHFGRGFASEIDKPPPLPGAAALANGAVLPPKRNRRRRGRSSSSDEAAPPRSSPCRPPAAAATGPSHAPASTTTPAGRPRVSLMSKWFPGSTLKRATIASCHAPPPEYVTATVRRMTTARESILLLRSGIEDLEVVLGELDAKTRGDAVLSPEHVRALVTESTAPGIGEALAQFAKEGGHRAGFVRAQLCRVMRRKARVRGPRVLSMKRWHEFVNHHGPESNQVPAVSEFLWMSSASTTALFTVLTQRFLRAVRQTGKVAAGLEAAGTGSARDENGEAATGESPRRVLDINSASEAEHDAPPREEEGEGEALDYGNPSPGTGGCWLVASQRALKTPGSSLTDAQCELLAFLRLFMPVKEGERRSTGYGVWLLACLAALDTPLDPDTDCLTHSLFRTCCDQVRVIGEWTGVEGDSPGALLDHLPAHEEGEESADAMSAAPAAYTRLTDVGRTELLALYTIIIVLAKLFRQNQNRLIPL